MFRPYMRVIFRPLHQFRNNCVHKEGLLACKNCDFFLQDCNTSIAETGVTEITRPIRQSPPFLYMGVGVWEGRGGQTRSFESYP